MMRRSGMMAAFWDMACHGMVPWLAFGLPGLLPIDVGLPGVDPEFWWFTLVGGAALLTSGLATEPWRGRLRTGAIPFAVGSGAHFGDLVANILFLAAAMVLVLLGDRAMTRGLGALAAVVAAFVVVGLLPGMAPWALTIALLAVGAPLATWVMLESGAARRVGAALLFSAGALGILFFLDTNGYREWLALPTALLLMAAGIWAWRAAPGTPPTFGRRTPYAQA